MDRFFEFLGNHPLLTAAAAAILILIALNEIVLARRGGKRISPAAAVRLMNDRGAQLIDLRPAAEFKRGHILGAINAPYPRLDEQLAALRKNHGDKPVILYCALGSNSPGAGAKLRGAGFQEVYLIAGGLNAWESASMPVTAKARA